MGFFEVASGKSLWRGYDYYKDGNVKSCNEVSNGRYKGIVEGSSGEAYDVTLDVAHPKRSTCTCPHAEGTRRICKHKAALYFTVFPDEADRLVRLAEEYEEEEERRREGELKDIRKYVNSLTKEQLREELFWRLCDEAERKSRWY